MNKREIVEILIDFKKEKITPNEATDLFSVSLPNHCTFWNKICDDQICYNGGICVYDNRL